MRKSLYARHDDRRKVREGSSSEVTFVLHGGQSMLQCRFSVYSLRYSVRLVNGSAALNAAFSRDDPDRVSTLETGRAATTGYLQRSVNALDDDRFFTHRHSNDAFSVIHTRNGYSVDGRVHPHDASG